MNWYQVWAVGFGISMILSSGCRSGDSWAPSLPKFGGSNLVFGSKPKEVIEPPALSFKPSEPNPPASSRTSTQLAANSATERSSSNDSSSNRSQPRAPYSFQESNNASPNDAMTPASRVASTLPTSPRTGPPASALGQLPSVPGGIGQVGYERSEAPGAGIKPQSAPFSSSVVNSPLLPSGQNPLDQRDIRSIPGGSLGNPLGNHAGNSVGNQGPSLNSNGLSTAGLPSLPPAPASISGLPSPMSSMSSLAVAGLPAAASAASISVAPASASLPSPSSSNRTAPSTSFRPGSVGGGQAPTTAAPNYRQTQHGVYPGLPSWPGPTAAPAAAPTTMPAGANPLPTSAPAFGPSGSGLPTSLPALGQPAASATPGLPLFPVSNQTSGQLVCDGEQCVIR